MQRAVNSAAWKKFSCQKRALLRDKGGQAACKKDSASGFTLSRDLTACQDTPFQKFSAFPLKASACTSWYE